MKKLRSMAPWIVLALLTGMFAACGLLALKSSPKGDMAPRVFVDRR